MQKVTKRNIALAIIFLLILVVVALLIGNFTFSYLGADVSDDVTTQGETTASGDTIIFSKDNDLNLQATTDNFNATSGNLTDTVNPSARLIASSKTNEATATYYAGVRINTNTFTYSSGTAAEVILTVRDETGAIVTTSDDSNLTYVTVTDKSGTQISGFDITGKTGAFNIAIKHPISTTSSTTGTTHTWTFTLTFVNYTYDQSVNENANLYMEVILQKDEIMPTLASYIMNEVYTGVDGENGLYYHDGQGDYVNADLEAGDNSYRYAGGDYKLISSGYDEVFTEFTTENEGDIGLINLYCDGELVYNGDSCSPETSRYYTIGPGDDGPYNTVDEALAQAVEYGDISVNNIKNYVCFGSDEEICPEDNLYRIIGVFDSQVKLIKYTSIGHYDWDSDYSYTSWENSSLNDFLNSTFYNTFTDVWKEKIALNVWKSSIVSSLDFTVKQFYNKEVLESNSSYNGKIGLLYVNDYGYASSSNNWNNSLTSNDFYNIDKEFNYANDNWMFSYSGNYNWEMYIGEWNMNLFNDNNRLMPMPLIRGGVDINYGDLYPISRPVFYLNSDVVLDSGDGTHDNPFRLEV